MYPVNATRKVDVTPTYIHIIEYLRAMLISCRECDDEIHTTNTGQKASFLFRSGIEYP